MAISLKSARELGAINGVKILVHGRSGAGKTRLIRTLPNPVILSAESGLLSTLNPIDGETEEEFRAWINKDRVIEIRSAQDLREAHAWLTQSEESREFESVALDSISEIAEVILASAKRSTKDPRQAYGDLADQMSEIIRSFRDITGRHVYFAAKTERKESEGGPTLYQPSAPGARVGQGLPYFFDEVFALRKETAKDGSDVRMLQTASDGVWDAKDRSGRLDMWESPHLGEIISKITNQERN